MSRRKQSRPVKVLDDDASEEECDGVSRGQSAGAAAALVNGHHVSTSTRRFDDATIAPIYNDGALPKWKSDWGDALERSLFGFPGECEKPGGKNAGKTPVRYYECLNAESIISP
ncbi:Hypothetical protein CINCED_3A007017 [Cinara cedri]|uniref:Uncharacterized protein n=1 Tax=Cinara cedri TaxID=506608 RepID=A0A5E4M5L4_9HEMI|nr:Hypothetical protein CINCED_3A007017 [Cinara cedri]